MESLNGTQGELTDQPPSHRRPVGAVAAFLVGVTVVILLVVGLGNRSAPPQPGEPMPTFALDRLQGGEWRPELSRIAFEDLLGQVVVVNFWASWCDPCRIEAGDLEAAWQAYKDRGVVFVGIAHKDAATKAEQHIAEFEVTYPNVQDPSGRVARAYGVTGVPETFVIAQDGTLVKHFIGVVTSAQLAGAIDPQLSR